MPPNKSLKISSESSIQSIAIAKIRMDGGTQPRSQLYDNVVAEYAEDIKQGDTFPPVILYYDGEEYWLADGFHRVRAFEAAGTKKVTAEVCLGTQRDAVLYAVGANAAHGLRRTNADKRRAVERLLRDNEWSKWSSREIARKCLVHHDTVSRIRKELEPESVGFRHIEPGDLGMDMSSSRLAQRGNTTYSIETSNIGRKKLPESKISTKRQRSIKRATIPNLPENQHLSVETGDIWKLGKSHYLFCGDLDASRFQKLMPSDIGLFLVFLKARESWPQAIPGNARNALSFYTSYGEDIDINNLRLIIENCLSTTTDADDPVVVVNLPDPLLFMLMENLYCPCYCVDPDPQRCLNALSAWTAIKQPIKKLQKRI